MYALKIEQLAELERLSGQGTIDLFYGDESRFCSEGHTPYGWQLPNERVHISVEKSYKINVWGLISRNNDTYWATTEQNIDTQFLFDRLEKLSFHLPRQTVVVLDNASIHKAKMIRNQLGERLVCFLFAALLSTSQYG